MNSYMDWDNNIYSADCAICGLVHHIDEVHHIGGDKEEMRGIGKSGTYLFIG